MNCNIRLPKPVLWQTTIKTVRRLDTPFVALLALVLSVTAIAYYFTTGAITAYGDAESHLNIAKRVIHSLTPGFAQLGGIWLPLPHLLMVPFVANDFLWRTGLAGSIISGACYTLASVFIYKLTKRVTGKISAGLIAFAVFAVNPNILYMQTTPLTEIPLIAFFVLSTYFFVKFLEGDDEVLSLIYAAFFGFCASLSRYDGWFLVLVETGLIVLLDLPHKRLWSKMKANSILFATLAFFGVGLWLLWDYLILGDPLYFTHSQFSAKSQQANWLSKGELPAYHNIVMAQVYYAATALGNTGVITFALFLVGIGVYLHNRKEKLRLFIAILLFVPFMFNVLTLYLGQSVIFIPSITPASFEWRLFNVRYGTMMIPVAAFFIGYLFSRLKEGGKWLILGLLSLQIALFGIGYEAVLSYDDGVNGLSASKHVDAQKWVDQNYDGGLVLLDDYARSMSVIRTHIPMQQIIYIGNKPYWEVSLKKPEKYAHWIIMQKNDAVWQHLYENQAAQKRLYKYFNKVYTSPEILVFHRALN